MEEHQHILENIESIFEDARSKAVTYLEDVLPNEVDEAELDRLTDERDELQERVEELERAIEDAVYDINDAVGSLEDA